MFNCRVEKLNKLWNIQNVSYSCVKILLLAERRWKIE